MMLSYAVNVLWWIVVLRPNRLGYLMIQEPLETWCFPQVGIRSGGTMLRPPGLVIHRDWCEVDFLPVNCPRTSNDFLVKYLLLVCWDYEIPNIWKNKIHVPNHQPVLHSKAISNQMSAILPKSVSHPLSSHWQTKSTCCLGTKCKKMQKASKSAGCFPVGQTKT